MDRGAVPVLEESANVCVLLNLEIVMCAPALVTSCLYQPKSRRRPGSQFLCFMSSVCRCC